MLVDDKLAKEKLESELEKLRLLWGGGNSTWPQAFAKVAQLIRNTDLTDCQVMAPDQGSVRNATDELDAKRYRWLRDSKGIIHNGYWVAVVGEELDEVIDAAIRALPVLEDQ